MTPSPVPRRSAPWSAASASSSSASTSRPGGGSSGTAAALGPIRYACGEHRGDLVAFVREHFGTIARHPWKMPPYATTRRSRDTERAIANGGLSPMPKWGLPS